VVGSQRPDEILAAWRRVGDDGQAACPGELDGVSAEGAARLEGLADLQS
jgi:hypothetical protein